MDAFIGEIRPFAFGWVPQDWFLCNGQSLYVPQYQGLYAVIGNLYGSTQQNYFNVPNLMGSALIGSGQQPGGTDFEIPDTGGSESVTISYSQMPYHNHTFKGAIGGGALRKSAPSDNTNYLANFNYTPTVGTSVNALGYVANPPSPPNVMLAANSISFAGGGTGNVTAAHENRQPYLTIGYYICAMGNFPSRP